MTLYLLLAPWLGKTERGSPFLKRLALIAMAIFILLTQYGCVTSRKEISHVEHRTSEMAISL